MLVGARFTGLMKTLVEIAERFDTGDPEAREAVDQLVPEMNRLESVALGDGRFRGFNLLGAVDSMIMLLTGAATGLNRNEFSALLVAVVGALRTFGAGFNPKTFRGKASVVRWFIGRVFPGPFELERCSWESEGRPHQFYKVLALYSLYAAVHGNSSHPMGFISKFFSEDEAGAVKDLLSEIVGGGGGSDNVLAQTVGEESQGVPDPIRDPPDGTQISLNHIQIVFDGTRTVTDESNEIPIPGSDDDSMAAEEILFAEISYILDPNGNVVSVPAS